MRKFFLLIFAVFLASLFHALSAQVVPTLYGNLIYTRTWGSQDATMAGIYRLNDGANPDVTLEYHPGNTNIYANGGAVYANGKYYVLTHVPNTGTVQSNTMYTFDADTWALISKKDIPLTTSALDLTWCPVDNKIYGVFLNTTKSGYVFGRLDVNDGSVEALKNIELKDGNLPVGFLVVAANVDGDIYGISSKGDLYRFDRSTGDYTFVGATGFVPASWNQSGCFDFTTRQLYWAACNADVSALFTVDTTTGEATRVLTFTDDEEFVGLYSLGDASSIADPKPVEGVAVSLEGNSLSGTIGFTMPASSISGEPLTGTLSYTVEDEVSVLLTGNAAPAQALSLPITLSQGLHHIVVYASTAAGKGASARVTVYAGDDTPAAPAAVTATKTDNGVAIEWSAVTGGENRGYINPAAVTYTVKRMPDAKTVAEGIAATACTDSEMPSALGDYTYEVQAVYAGNIGKAAVSAPLVLGASYTPPAAFDFTKEADFKFFTVINANNDDKTWEWSVNGARCLYHRTNDTDDWLVSPAMVMKAGYRYTIEVEGRSSSKTYKEKFEVMAGTAPEVSSLTQTIIEPTELTTGSKESFSAVFIPESDGTYYIGIHGISAKYKGGIYMYGLSVSEPVAPGAPVAPAQIRAEAAGEGALQATVYAQAPAKAVDGTDLVALVKAEFTNLTTGALVGVVANPEPGAEVSVVDGSPVNGTNEYAAVFYSAAGKGYQATASVYVGQDTPLPVGDVVLKQVGDNAELSWTAPTGGVNGGYVDVAALTYRVAITSTSADVATGLAECKFTDQSLDGETQSVIQYTVYAVNSAGNSAGANSNSLTFGKPYPAPFAESFAGGKEDMTPWITVKEGDKNYSSWTPSTKGYDNIDYSQDGDLGWVSYSSKGTISLISPVIDLSTLSSPQLKFWMVSPDGPVGFDVSVSADRGISWQTLHSVEAECAEWQCVSLDLDAISGSQCAQVAFKAYTQSYNDMKLDNIRITDKKAVDLGVSSFTGPESADSGTAPAFKVRLLNEGSTPATAYTVEIYSDDKVLASVQGSEIAPDAFADFSVDVPLPVNAESITLDAKVTLAGDEYAGNDMASLTVALTTPRLPVIGSLTAVAAGAGVKLSWERPAEERNPSAMTDDLETLTAWDFGGVNATNPLGTIDDYMVYDADGAATVVISSWNKHPNATAPMAFQVAKKGQYPDPNLSSYGVNARSGSYSFVAWGASEGATSDYLILPELFPGETTISFWAHSAAVSYGLIMPEKIEMLYSTTSSALSDFVVYGDAQEVPCGWDNDDEHGFVHYECTLPSDARYAAIRVTISTQDNKAVVIDDISYVSATSPMEKLTINGYNIYRDGEKIATTTDPEYVDSDSPEGEHRYNVTTNYSIGEAPFSNEASIVTTGIENVVGGFDSSDAKYYNLQGIEVRNPAPGSIYIVRYPDGTSVKRLMK